jgi:tetratricopeptide (TPR) repeat protein
MVEYYLDNVEIALVLCEQALDIYTFYNKQDSIGVTWTLQKLAVIHWGIGEYEKAHKLYERAFRIKQNYYQTPKHINMAITYQGLGLLEFSKGNYQTAKELLEQDLDIRQNYYQSDSHIRMASSMHMLGISEEGLGNYERALKQIQKSFDIQYRYFKDKTPQLVAHDYSPVIEWPGLTEKNTDKAVEYYQKALEITKKLFGQNSYMAARYHYLLGSSYEVNGKIDSAIEQYEQALVMAKKLTSKINNKKIQKGHEKNIQKIQKRLKNLKQN